MRVIGGFTKAALFVLSLLVKPTNPTDRGQSRASQPLLRFRAPSVTSSLRFGYPGFTSPGTFRPWSFSDLRRFTPASIYSACFIRVPLMGFKEQRGYNFWRADCPKSYNRLECWQPKSPCASCLSVATQPHSLRPCVVFVVHPRHHGHRKEEGDDNRHRERRPRRGQLCAPVIHAARTLTSSSRPDRSQNTRWRSHLTQLASSHPIATRHEWAPTRPKPR